MFIDNVFNLVNQEDCHECDHGNSEGNGKNAFRCGELSFVRISVLISIFLLISLQDFSVQSVVGAHLEENEADTVLARATLRIDGTTNQP